MQGKSLALAAKDRRLQDALQRASTGGAGSGPAARAQGRGPDHATPSRQTAREQAAAMAALERKLSEARKRAVHLKGRDTALSECVRRLQLERDAAVQSAEAAAAALAQERDSGSGLQRKLAALHKAVDKVRAPSDTSRALQNLHWGSCARSDLRSRPAPEPSWHSECLSAGAPERTCGLQLSW